MKTENGYKRNNFTEQDINKMIELHNQGLLHREIAEIFNTSRSSIDRALRDQVASRHPWITQDKEEQICELYKQYQNLSKVGEIIHSNGNTVKDICIKNGIHILNISESKRTKSLNEHYFDKIDNQNKAYFLGLLFADGNISKSNNSITLCLQEKDLHIIESFKKDLDSEHKITFLPLNEKNPNCQNQYRIAISSKHMKNEVAKYGLIPNKSLVLEYPKNIPDVFQKDFIRGYMDGDGNISKTHRRISFLGTLSFCEGLRDVLLNLYNIRSRIKDLSSGRNPITKELIVNHAEDARKLLQILYDEAELYLFRKHNIYQKYYVA